MVRNILTGIILFFSFSVVAQSTFRANFNYILSGTVDQGGTYSLRGLYSDDDELGFPVDSLQAGYFFIDKNGQIFTVVHTNGLSPLEIEVDAFDANGAPVTGKGLLTAKRNNVYLESGSATDKLKSIVENNARINTFIDSSRISEGYILIHYNNDGEVSRDTINIPSNATVGVISKSSDGTDYTASEVTDSLNKYNFLYWSQEVQSAASSNAIVVLPTPNAARAGRTIVFNMVDNDTGDERVNQLSGTLWYQNTTFATYTFDDEETRTVRCAKIPDGSYGWIIDKEPSNPGVVTSASAPDTTQTWVDTDSTVKIRNQGEWMQVAPDRQFMTLNDLLNNANKIPFKVGEIIEVASTGARYKIREDSLSGYVVDSVAVLPVGGKYAKLLNPSFKRMGLSSDSTAITESKITNAILYSGILEVSLFVEIGTYNFSGYTPTAGDIRGVNIIGENKKETIITGWDKTPFRGDVYVKNITFKDCEEVFYQRSTVDNIFSDTVDIIIEDCIVDQTEEIINISNTSLLSVNKFVFKNCNVTRSKAGQGIIINKYINDALVENSSFENPDSSFTSIIILGDNLDIVDKAVINNCTFYDINSTGEFGSNTHGVLVYGRDITISNCLVDSTNIFRFYPRGRNAKVINCEINMTGTFPSGADFTPVFFKAGSTDDSDYSLYMSNVSIDAFDNPVFFYEGYGNIRIDNCEFYTEKRIASNLEIDLKNGSFRSRFSMYNSKITGGRISFSARDTIFTSIDFIGNEIKDIDVFIFTANTQDKCFESLLMDGNQINTKTNLFNPASIGGEVLLYNNRISTGSLIQGVFDVFIADGNRIYDNSTTTGVRYFPFSITVDKFVFNNNIVRADSLVRFYSEINSADTILFNNNEIWANPSQLSPSRLLSIPDTLNFLSVKDNVVNINNATGDFILTGSGGGIVYAQVTGNYVKTNATNFFGITNSIDSLIFTNNYGLRNIGDDTKYNLIGNSGYNYVTNPINSEVENINVTLDSLKTYADQSEADAETYAVSQDLNDADYQDWVGFVAGSTEADSTFTFDLDLADYTKMIRGYSLNDNRTYEIELDHTGFTPRRGQTLTILIMNDGTNTNDITFSCTDVGVTFQTLDGSSGATRTITSGAGKIELVYDVDDDIYTIVDLR